GRHDRDRRGRARHRRRRHLLRDPRAQQEQLRMTSHLQADADPSRWVAVRGSGIAGSRYRKAAINVLLQSTLGIVPGQPGLGLFSFIMRRGIKADVRGADGRFLVWSWKDDPSLLAVEARVTDMTPQFRAARASMPI